MIVAGTFFDIQNGGSEQAVLLPIPCGFFIQIATVIGMKRRNDYGLIKWMIEGRLVLATQVFIS